MSKMFGEIVRYDVAKGYGFLITQHPSGEKMSIFFHISECDFVPEPSQRVTFTLGAGRKGPQAMSVRLASAEDVALQVLSGGA